MKKHGLVLIGALLFVACQQVVPGKLQVNDNLVLNIEDEQEQFLAGEYKSQLKLKSKKKLVLTIERNDKESDFIFKIPKNADLPQRNGDIQLSAEEVGQPYDVDGFVKTDVTRSESRYDTESCQEQRPHTVCRTDSRGNTTCHTEYRTYYGWRDVRYHLRTEHKNFSLNLMEGDRVIANFDGIRREAQRMYEYTGPCR